MGCEKYNGTREKTVEHAKGVVLEIGFGSGFNVPFYNPQKVSLIYALEPSKEIFDLATETLKKSSIKTIFLHSDAEQIPLPDNSIDTVVSTWVLCSVHKPNIVLKEIYRVLKPGGQYLFVEHGLSTFKPYAFLQNAITPITKYFTGNCHLNRDIAADIQKSDFSILRLESFQEERTPLLYSFRGVLTKN